MMSIVDVFFKAADILLDIPQNKHEILYDRDKVLDIKKNIRYSKSAKDCKLDIYRIPSKKPQPVLFYVHGGGFVAGGKDHRRGTVTWLAKMGICVVNVEYGRSPKYDFKESVKMLAEALEFVNKNARKYHFDTSRVMFGGDSSGGYCALYLTDICTNQELCKELGIKQPKIKPAGLYTNCGIFDLDRMLKIPVIGLVAGILSKEVMGAGRREFATHPDNKLCSPINYVNKNFPKEIFVTYSKKDIFCAGQTEKLIELLADFGITPKGYYATKLFDNHCFPLNWVGKATEENNRLLEKFVRDFVAGK